MNPSGDRPEDIAQDCLEAARHNVDIARDSLQRGVEVGEVHLRGEYPDTCVVVEINARHMGPGPIEYPIWEVGGWGDTPRVIFWTHDIYIDVVEAR